MNRGHTIFSFLYIKDYQTEINETRTKKALNVVIIIATTIRLGSVHINAI